MANGDRDTFIGVDVGGTHTDVIVVRDGGVTRAKALTTPDDLSVGVLDSIGVAAELLELPRAELLAGTQRIVNGTTVVTNAVTELRGRRVGVLVTRGFRDTFRIARGPRLNVSDDHAQTNVPAVVPWERIHEVTERLDYAGEEVAPLDEDGVRAAARELVEEHQVEAIAVCFLWSFVDPSHEARAAAIVNQLYPDVFVVTSAQAHPLSREFERWNTAIFTAFVHHDVATYVEGLEAKLHEEGLPEGALSLFQCLGGALSTEEARLRPLQLMDSGPVGGVIASRSLARELGVANVICADMGGTSFDVALVRDGEFTYSKRRSLGHPAFVTGLAAVDIVSIGAGGGSIAHVDRRGVPQVGPHSAGAVPGPACYGRGGEEATVTDAMVVLGFIDPGAYLGGRRELDLGAAETAVSALGERHGWSAQESSLGIYEIAVANMVNAIREITVQKGHDPRDFTLFAYGGMTPAFAWAVASRAGVETVVVPPQSAAFSAWGVIQADHVRRYDRTLSWNLEDADRVGEVNEVAAEMAGQAQAAAAEAGFAPEALSLQRVAACRFLGQIWEIEIPLEDRPLRDDEPAELRERFIERYEEIYGKGTAWKDAPVVVLDLSIVATAKQEIPGFRAWEDGSESPAPASTRQLVEPQQRQTVAVPVFDIADVGAGAELRGPAIVDGHDTTIFVPTGVLATRDRLGGFTLRAAQPSNEKGGAS
jgi:N-methylhydantoinase A